jgi:hypothetical protein
LTNKDHKQEKIILILEQTLDIYQQFLDKISSSIIDPFTKGDLDECNQNLSKLGKNFTILDIVKLVIRGAVLLAPLMLKISSGNSEKKYLDEQEIAERTAHYQKKLKNIIKSGL